MNVAASIVSRGFFRTEPSANWAGRITIVMLIGCLAVGFWLRFRHLGDLGLVNDEGVQAQAVQRTLERGVPIFASGLFYTRGVPFLYAQAGTAKLFGLDEFSLRLPSVVFGTVTIWAAFLLGKMLYGPRVGLLTAAMMTFSVWEIEMSRFARFYTAFQFTYLVSLLCFYRWQVAGEKAYRPWFIVSAFLAIMMHDLGAMLAMSFVAILPSALYPLRRKVTLALSALAMIALSLVYFINVRAVLPVVTSSAPEAVGGSFGTTSLRRVHKFIETILLQLPDVTLLSYIGSEHPLLLSGLLLVASSASAYILYRSWAGGSRWLGICALPIIWVAFMCQSGLVVVLLIAYYFAFVAGRQRRLEREVVVAGGAAAVCLILWSLLPLIDPFVSTGRIAWAMFSYPNFYDQFLKWYLWGWPFVSFVSAIGIVQLARRFAKHSRDPRPLFILGAIVLPAVATSFFKPNDDAARYTFHLYPMIIIVFAYVVAQAIAYCADRLKPFGELSRPFVSCMLGGLALVISQDANPVHAWSVANWTYQTQRHPIRSIVVGSNSRTHPDYKNPSLYVRAHLRAGDKVIVAGGPVTAAICHYYIGRVDYTLSNRASVEMLDRKAGKLTDRYIGSEIITARFAITERTLGALRSAGVSSRILAELHPLRDHVFFGEPLFLQAVKNVLGVQETAEYRPLILNASVVANDGTCCRIDRIAASESEGRIWLVGNWNGLTRPDRDYLDFSKAYLRPLLRRPDYLGLDGQTFALRIDRSAAVHGESASATH
jgi:hypothetical protein